MFKKLLSLAAAAVLGLSANAGTIVEDYFIDYTTTTWNFYVMSYIPSQENGWLTVTQTRGSWERVDGEAVFTPNDDKDEDGQPDISWYQLFVADGIPTNISQDYHVTIYGKADVEAGSNMNMQWGWGDGQSIPKTVNFGTEWDEIDVVYPEIGGSSCALVLQPGTQETTFEIQWIKVWHEDNAAPVEWIDLAVNGDAEGEYGETPVAYGKSNIGANPSEVLPAVIENVGGEHGNVFVVDAGAMTENPWDNQFWIVSPQTFSEGEAIRISFDYKADKVAKASTQCHAAPGSYLHWACLGDVNFTTEWQSLTKTYTVESASNGMYSIAFNLNELEDANKYYFDNIKIEIMKLDEGWFIAGDFNDKNLSEAVEFAWDDDKENFVVVVGTEEKPASQVKISTRRGNDNAFNSHAIKVDDSTIVDGEFVEYTLGGSKWINLPYADIWEVRIDTDYEQVCFTSGADPSGIESVVNDNVAPVYYNIQGVQVQKPVKGNLYIVKKGNKVSKIVVR